MKSKEINEKAKKLIEQGKAVSMSEARRRVMQIEEREQDKASHSMVNKCPNGPHMSCGITDEKQ